MNEEEFLELEATVQPSLTYKVEKGRIIGQVDGLKAIAQAVDKVLKTERFNDVIYTDRYGVELERFIGQPFDFVKSDLERTLGDALKVDDRINGISDFEMEASKKDSLCCRFQVETLEGTLQVETEVGI